MFFDCQQILQYVVNIMIVFKFICDAFSSEKGSRFDVRCIWTLDFVVVLSTV